MIRRALKIILTLSLLGVILAGLLFSGYAVTASAPGWLRTVGIEIQAACRDAGTQWMVVVCLVSYFVVFLFLAKRQTISTPHPGPLPVRGGEGGAFAFRAFFRGKWADPDFWLMGFVALVLLRYAFDYSNAAKSLQVVVLLTGIVVGKGVALWVAWVKRPILNTQPSTINKARTVLSILVLLLAASALCQLERLIEFQYRAQRRWTGVWDNPNIYGVLMGVGAVLSIGLLMFRKRPTSNAQPSTSNEVGRVTPCAPGEYPPINNQLKTINYAQRALLLAAAALCAYGLLKSYSRGAWLGTAVGLGCLMVSWVWRLGSGGLVSKSEIGHQKSGIVSFRRSWFPSSILLLSILVICFWQFRHTESPLARRVFSVGNPNDFSWRNRVTAWQGAGRMMWDKPLAGFGWGKAEEIYGKDYRAARLEETAAVQLNDYLMIGISAGAPALGCLLGYLLLTGFQVSGFKFQGRQTETLDLGLKTLDSMPTICFAGAIVGMIGFWFDGGLFKLPTCVVFWVLVELSSCRSRGDEAQIKPEKKEELNLSRSGDFTAKHAKHTKTGMGFRWVAGFFALGALGMTALHLGTPQLAVTERTISIARKFLVPPKEQPDFELLAAKPIWSGKRLKTLLQHAHLANYNRSLVNWKLDDQVYREFILSPEIDPAFDGEMDWRRPLWENFYPRIRKESGLEAAAEIVGRHLQERVAVVENGKAINSKFEIQNSKLGGGRSIAEIWQRGQSDLRGYEIVSVAALRSVGIPGRLAASGQAEFWTGAEWKPSPHPVVEFKTNK